VRLLPSLAAAGLLFVLGCQPVTTPRPPSSKFAAPAAASKPPDGSVLVNVTLLNDEFLLPNGMLVALHREPTASSVFLQVRYHVGSKDDPAGRAGLAHLYEHLMFEGSLHTGEKDHNQWVEELGGTSNATTDADTTDYYEQVPPSALATALWLESDRMAYPLSRVGEGAFAREREVVKNEGRERYEDRPYGQLGAIARSAVFGTGHPYSRPTIGYANELDAITLEEMRAFAKTYYRPNNATLVIAGAIDLARTRELVAKYFGDIPPGSPLPSRTFPAAKLARNVRVEVAADVQAPRVTLAWPAPPVHGHGLIELEYGTRFFEGRVHRRLVTEKRIADDVDVAIDEGRLGSIVFATVALKPGASPDEAISTLDEYLTEASRAGRLWAWDNFPDYRTRTLVGRVAALEHLSERASQMLHALDYHDGKETMQADLRALLAVSAADVGAAMEQLLADAPRATIVYVPTRGAPRAGRVGKVTR